MKQVQLFWATALVCLKTGQVNQFVWFFDIHKGAVYVKEKEAFVY